MASRWTIIQIVLLATILASLVGCSSSDTSGIISTENVYPFRPEGRYATELKDCVLINTVEESCTLLTLPLIGQEFANPSVEQILERLLVTHDWMGQRFARLLNDAPADLLQLFGSATAILIGSEVRPSFYSTLNGTIQLDPAYLWQTVPEKRTISIADDFRRNYGADLIFLSDWEWMNGEVPALRYFSLEDDSVREYEDIIIRTMGLLYHELGHANDYVPTNIRQDLDVGLSIYDAISAVRDQRLSAQLHAVNPLLDEEMMSLAEVRYRDNQPTDREVTMTAANVGSLMDNDGATTFYSYLTDREDLANLLQTTMLSYHYDVTLNVGFEIKPVDATSCADYIVGWGMRNRLADPLVTPRAIWVADKVLGISPELQSFFDQDLGSTTLMRQGDDWCSNRVVNPRASATRNRDAGLEHYVPNQGIIVTDPEATLMAR